MSTGSRVHGFGGLITQAQIKPVRNYNALYVFALP
jgi:hypothetical protein